jgi:mannan endo-1,4-beta-mannosidase
MIKRSTRFIYLLLLLPIGLVLPRETFSQMFEAENAVLSGGASKISCSTCSGGWAVSQQEGSLSFNINIPSTGFYNVYIFASAPGDKINIISINGESGDFSVKESNVYKKTKIVSMYRLTAGSHKVEIKKSWGWINIDYFEFEKADPSTRFNIDHDLVTPDPQPEAKALYQFLLDHYNKRIISGGMTLNDIPNSTWLDWIKTNTGKEVALLGLDFMHSVGKGTGWINDTVPVWDAKTWYNRNGIPCIMWHWRDPLKETEAFYTYSTNRPTGTRFDVSKISDINSQEYVAMLEDIDKVSGLLKVLHDQNIPVIWRPLHEASGGWFWWGAKGATSQKALWNLMYDRMVNHHGLKNLIWVWTAEPGDDNWYPGDQYVDIVGRDIYKDGDHSSHTLEFNTLNDRFKGKKMIALSEHGSMPDPDNLVKDEAAWSWLMPWYREYTTDSKYNSVSLWQKTMNHDYVITLDEMPNLRTYVKQEVSEPERPSDPLPTPVKGKSPEKGVFSIYPTETLNEVTIKGDKRISSVIVYDIMGRNHLQHSPNSFEVTLSLDGLKSGLYFIKINEAETHKVLKK